jgi:hypothetical protein
VPGTGTVGPGRDAEAAAAAAERIADRPAGRIVLLCVRPKGGDSKLDDPGAPAHHCSPAALRARVNITKGRGMSTVEIPDSLSVAGWDKQKNAMAKDKAVGPKLQGESTKVTEALKKLDQSQSAVDFGMFDAKGITSAAAADAAVAKIEAAVKGDLKNLLGAAKLAGAAADTFAAAAEKLRKTVKGDSEKVAIAAMTAASTASKAADKFVNDLNSAIASAQSELQALSAKLKAGEKKGAPGAAPANPKAVADGKVIGALIKKSVALLRSPKGSPVPVRFLVLQEEKKIRLYLGPKPDNAFAKLKSQFAPKAKIRRIKDPKGVVIWEKAALTFVSDILKGGLAKPIQVAIREQTKLSVKVRVKKSDGSVDEAENVPDLTDDQLKVDPAEEAELQSAGKDFAKRLAELQPQIAEALKGKSAQKLKVLIASVQSHGKAQKFDEASDDLDEIESLLEGADAPDDDQGDDASAADKGAPAGVPPAKAFAAKLTALMPKIRAAIAAGGDVAKQIKDMTEQAGKLVQSQVQADVDKANTLLSNVEDLLGKAAGATGGGAFSVQKLATARLEWIAARDKAISEITRLSKAIVDAYRGETDQQAQVKAAITKLAGLATRLKSGLDNELDAALNAKDAASREERASKAKDSLRSIKKLMDEDELMQSLDGNEILGDMHVVAPMKERLSAIEAALG